MTKFYMVRECLFLESQPRPVSRGRSISDPNFGGSLILVRSQFDLERPNSAWFIHRDACLGVSYASCILRNVSRRLSAIDEFLVKSIMLIVTEKSGHRIRIV